LRRFCRIRLFPSPFALSRSFSAATGTFESGPIDVSTAAEVEVSTTLFGDGGLDSSGNWHDHVQVFAKLDDGTEILIDRKDGGSNGFRDVLDKVIDVSQANSMNLEIKATTTGGNEVYHFEEISVELVTPAVTGSPLPWIESFEQLPDGAMHDDGTTSWRVYDLVGTGTFDVDGDALVINGAAEGKLDSSEIDVSSTTSVKISTTLYQVGSLDAGGNWKDHVKVFAVLDNGVKTQVHEKEGGTNGLEELLETVVDVSSASTLKIEIAAKTTGDDEKYAFRTISVVDVAAPLKLAGAGGDPHFKRWNRKSFEWQGECDLVLIHSDHVNGNQKLDIHVRTVIREWWSQIESAAMRIGDVTLQMDADKFFVNGKEYSDADLPLQTAEFYIENAGDHAATKQLRGAAHLRGAATDVLKTYHVTFNDKSTVVFRILKDFMNVEVSGHREDFEQSLGLMGNFDTGKPHDRSNARMFDLHEFAMEWQVDPAKDPVLFLEAKGPQLPAQKCRMPDPTQIARRGRRLQKDNKMYDAALTACAGKGDETDACMSDVLATGDLAMALLH
jgi:hypothetical protein